MRQQVRKAISLIGPYPYNPYLIFLVLFSLLFSRFVPLLADVPAGSERPKAAGLIILVSVAPSLIFSMGVVLLRKYRIWSSKNLIFYILEITIFQLINQKSVPLINRFIEHHIGNSYVHTFQFNFKVLMISVVLTLVALALIHQAERRIIERLDKADELIEQLNSDREDLVKADEELREQTSRFLHDRVQSDLMVVGMKLKSISGQSNIEVNEVIEKAIARLENTRTNDLRDLVQILTPNFEAGGIIGALNVLAEQYRPSVKVFIEIDTVSEHLGSNVLLGVFRISEQALLNALIHGPAKQVAISLKTDAQGVSELAIADNGHGVDMANLKAGVGTAIIDSWIGILNGEKTIESVPGHGYRITVKFLRRH